MRFESFYDGQPMECRSVNAVNNFCSQIEKNNNRAKQREGKRISVCVCVRIYPFRSIAK